MFEALYWLDSIITDAFFGRGSKLSKGTVVLIKKLLDPETLSCTFDEYIVSMVTSYIRRKQHIIINIHGLKPIQEAISGLVIKDKIENTVFKSEERILLSSSNLISPEIVILLPNVTNICIKTDFGIFNSYAFDMYALLEIITKLSNCKKIEVQQQIIKEYEGKSWIANLWNVSEANICNKYEKHQYRISFNKKDVKQGQHDMCLEYFEINKL